MLFSPEIRVHGAVVVTLEHGRSQSHTQTHTHTSIHICIQTKIPAHFLHVYLKIQKSYPTKTKTKSITSEQLRNQNYLVLRRLNM